MDGLRPSFLLSFMDFWFRLSFMKDSLIFPIFIPMQGCPERCIYCDQYRISGQEEPGITPQLNQAIEFLGRNRGKIRQVAFYGGSFTALPQSIREEYIRPLMPFWDEDCSLRISTHPAYIDAEILAWCRENHIKTIELGVQDFSDQVLKASARGYKGETAIRAAKLVKEHGFELGLQLMPGLPGWDEDTIQHNYQTVCELKPDFLRLYPCLVIKGTKLEKLWQGGHFQPLGLMQAIEQCADWLKLCTQEGIRVIKLGLPSNLKTDDIAAGPWHPAFGQLVKAEVLIRLLESCYAPGSIIELDKKDWNLIIAHNGFYLEILKKRLRNCAVYPVNNRKYKVD